MNWKQRLGKKLKKNGGFTLIEMLIVVAIIAILVVVSIPMVSSSLDKAKEAADAANMRAAKAAAMIEYMTDGLSTGEVYYYNADTGKAEALDAAPNAGDAGYDYGQSSDNQDGFVTITIGTDGTVTNAGWTKKTG